MKNINRMGDISRNDLK